MRGGVGGKAQGSAVLNSICSYFSAFLPCRQISRATLRPAPVAPSTPVLKGPRGDGGEGCLGVGIEW